MPVTDEQVAALEGRVSEIERRLGYEVSDGNIANEFAPGTPQAEAIAEQRQEQSPEVQQEQTPQS